MLLYNSDVDASSLSGDTPLMFAVMCGYPSIVNLLLKAGADKNKKNNGGISAMDCLKVNKRRVKKMKKLLTKKRTILDIFFGI